MKTKSIRVNEEVWKQFSQAVADAGKTKSDVLRRFIVEFIKTTRGNKNDN